MENEEKKEDAVDYPQDVLRNASGKIARANVMADALMQHWLKSQIDNGEDFKTFNPKEIVERTHAFYRLADQILMQGERYADAVLKDEYDKYLKAASVDGKENKIKVVGAEELERMGHTHIGTAASLKTPGMR